MNPAAVEDVDINYRDEEVSDLCCCFCLLELMLPMLIICNDKQTGRTALYWACYGGDVEIVKLLLKKHVDLNIKDNVRVYNCYAHNILSFVFLPYQLYWYYVILIRMV